MYERLEICPSCKNTKFKNTIICKDHLVSGESFALVECSNCSLLFTNPRPDVASLPKYYKSEDYISHTNKGNSLTNMLYKVARFFTIRNKYQLITKHAQSKSILDYGCGTGDVLKFLHDKGWETTGIEPDSDALQIATNKGINAYTSLDEIPKKQKYSVITLWHVLEHVSELRPTLKALKKKITEDGTLIIAVPNPESWDAKHYKKYWAAYDVPRHLYHFTQDSISKLFAKHKFNLIETIPMKLDSFYVSLLSEKNKTGNSNYLTAFKNGMKSNRSAKNNNNNYSSLIYVLRK